MTTLLRCSVSLYLLTSFVLGSDDIFHPYSGRVSSPSDVGVIHTEAFEALANLHSTQKPKNRTELQRNVANIMTSYLCHDGDSECKKEVKAKNRRRFKNPVLVDEWRAPEDLDSSLKGVVESAKSIVGTLRTGDNVDDVVNGLESLEQSVNGRKDTDRLHKTVVLSGLSVAKESTKLWNDVYSNPDHALHGLHHESYYQANNGRTLQQNLSVNITNAILSDSLAAIDGGFLAINEFVDTMFTDVFGFILIVLTTMPLEAISASAAAFLVGDMYE